MTLIAYHNDPTEKSAVLAELAAHRAADALQQGYGYWKDGKGCAIGCLLRNGNHIEYESRFGIPICLARLEDCIFEGLPIDQARQWPERFMGAIRPGQDLSRVHWQLLHWLLTDESVNPGINHEIVRNAVRQCAEFIEILADGGIVTWSAAWSAARSAESAESAARSAESAARSAESAESAASAAWSAASAESAAESAARSAAWSAARSAESAESAAWSAAWSAARSAESAVWSAASAAMSAASAASAARSAESAVWSAASAAMSAASAESAASAAYVKIADKLIALIDEAE